MINKLQRAMTAMAASGDTVICAVSGGKDSMALLWGLYLLKDKLGISLAAAHFDHGLRAESSRDAAFVENFCRGYDIPVYMGSGTVTPGKKGLEAAAREARYAFFETLPGIIATAHTANDNAETVLMHLVRGTGLKGLGGIAPRNGRCIRPMLAITRTQVEEFLEEYSIPHVEDATNAGDAFLRNRLRHHVMPLLKAENPRLAENVSAMALRLRMDEDALMEMSGFETLPGVEELRKLHPALRCRMLELFLKNSGVKEPEAQHIALLESLVWSKRPSARAEFPGGVVIGRRYDRLEVRQAEQSPEPVALAVGDTLQIPQMHLEVSVIPAQSIENTKEIFTVCPRGPMCLRYRQEGDSLRLPGGTKSLKKLLVDHKIPAHLRRFIPIIADEQGVLAVYGMGVHQDAKAGQLPAVQIIFKNTQ